MSDQCRYLEPHRLRRGVPTWWTCGFTGKEINPKTKPCTREGCTDYRERGDAEVAGDKQRRIDWDGPASATLDYAPGAVTLREYAQNVIAKGYSVSGLARDIGCSWSTLKNAVEPKPEPQVLAECWNCGSEFPENDMREDGDTLVCETCYRKAHQEPEPDPPAPRCQRCECEVDGHLILSGVGTVCEPCAELFRQGWTAGNYAPNAPTDDMAHAESYLRYLGLGDAEVFGLGVWVAAKREVQ